MKLICIRVVGCLVLSVVASGCGGDTDTFDLPMAESPDVTDTDEAASTSGVSESAEPSDAVGSPHPSGDAQLSRLQDLIRWEPEVPEEGAPATFSLDRTHPVYGTLNLHLSPEASQTMLDENKPPQLLDSDIPKAQAAFEKIAGINEPGEAYAALLKLRDQFPFWPTVHGALGDCAVANEDLDKAVYHTKQLIYTDPSFANVARLGRFYGQQGKYDDSLVVLSHLFENRSQAGSQQVAIGLTNDLLVTLQRAQQGERMVQVADQAIAEFGQVSSFEYQAILGFVLQNLQDNAKSRLRRVLTELSEDDPLLPRFQQMKQVLGVE
ncbi:MAG: tetratricopeptide repeat protein [Planctomycetaceae bacterium]